MCKKLFGRTGDERKETIRRVGHFQTLQFFVVVITIATITCAAAISFGAVALLHCIGVLGEDYNTSSTIVLIALLLCLSFSIIIALISSRIYVRPVDEIVAATRRVASGDFSVRVNEKGALGEMRTLAASFNSMSDELSGIELFREDFINNFSHEFKTPIVSISGFAHQLTRDDLTEGQRIEYAQLIVAESERLASMSSNILLLTKLENQEIISDKTRIDLSEQLRDCLLSLQSLWEEKELALHLGLASNVYYFGNSELIRHIWMNLLSNAIKFSRENGSICVLSRILSGNAEVVISDNGAGMDADAKAHMFEKFYQGDRTHFQTGNGLGLSIVKRIVDMCGGEILVKSDPGYGTEFTVRLPLEDKKQ